MVGHVMSIYMQEKGHDVQNCGQNSVIKNDLSELASMINNGSFDAVINCTAIINQDAETDKAGAVRVNALLPHFLETATEKTKTIVVHRSTDCIFSGTRGRYSLDDWPDATSFYARSKALGELDNTKDITIRTSLIGPETDENGVGLFNWFFNQSGEVNGFANSIWTGVTTIEYAKAVEWLLLNNRHGVFQLVPDYAISKYELLCIFEKNYPANRIIKRIDNTRTDKSLIAACGGYEVPSYEQQIADMKKWTDSHRYIYKYQ